MQTPTPTSVSRIHNNLFGCWLLILSPFSKGKRHQSGTHLCSLLPGQCDYISLKQVSSTTMLPLALSWLPSIQGVSLHFHSLGRPVGTARHSTHHWVSHWLTHLWKKVWARSESGGRDKLRYFDGLRRCCLNLLKTNKNKKTDKHERAVTVQCQRQTLRTQGSALHSTQYSFPPALAMHFTM